MNSVWIDQESVLRVFNGSLVLIDSKSLMGIIAVNEHLVRQCGKIVRFQEPEKSSSQILRKWISSFNV